MSGPLEPHHPGLQQRPLPAGGEDTLIREEPLRITVGGEQVLTMRTPGADADLALGFLLGEGVLQDPSPWDGARLEPGEPDAARPDELIVALKDGPRGTSTPTGRLSRTHEVRPSCGACGLVDAEHLLEHTPPLLPGVPRLRAGTVERLVQALHDHQPMFQATGACHGAVIAGADGSIWGAGEDVGRHNALDKAIGSAVRGLQGAHGPTGVMDQLARGIAVLSGRAGYDLVMKALRVRIPVIISVSAPSALGLELCEVAGATLVGFARGGASKVYCGAERLAAG